jgi:hypothetical protein
MMRILDRIHRLAVMGEFRVFEAHWLLIRHSQWLLKEEWETVESEASGGLRRALVAVGRWRHARAYRAFCAEEGSLASVETEVDSTAKGNGDI